MLLKNISSIYELSKDKYHFVSGIHLFSVYDEKINELFEYICDNFLNLEELIITNSNLSIISKNIIKLKRLQKLWLEQNKIEKIPDELTLIENLSELEITDNPIKNLPNSLANLQNLSLFIVNVIKNVFIEKNKMLVIRWKKDIKIPDDITHLNILNGYDANLNDIPMTIEYLKISHVNKPLMNLPYCLKTLDLDYTDEITMKDIRLPFGCRYIGQKI